MDEVHLELLTSPAAICISLLDVDVHPSGQLAQHLQAILDVGPQVGLILCHCQATYRQHRELEMIDHRRQVHAANSLQVVRETTCTWYSVYSVYRTGSAHVVCMMTMTDSVFGQQPAHMHNKHVDEDVHSTCIRVHKSESKPAASISWV